MKKLWIAVLFLASASAWAGGFGIQAGAFSPTEGLDDNDNSVLLGANLTFKLAVIGIKIEGFYVDSSGTYADALGTGFGPAEIDIEAILAADVMFYPVGGLFFLQGGVNYLSLDAKNIDIDVIDNQLGLNLGLGVTLLDKLMIQGKVVYTPDAVRGDAVDVLEGLDSDYLGFMATVGWQF